VGGSARVIRGRTLRGPGFTVLTRGEHGNVVVEVDGRAAPEQVLRILRSEGALVASDGRGRIEATITTSAGADLYVFTEDLRHRLLFSRSWDRPGLSGVFYGLNPIIGDMEGALDQVPPRTSLRNIVGALHSRPPLANRQAARSPERDRRPGSDASPATPPAGGRQARPDQSRPAADTPRALGGSPNQLAASRTAPGCSTPGSGRRRTTAPRPPPAKRCPCSAHCNASDRLAGAPTRRASSRACCSHRRTTR